MAYSANVTNNDRLNRFADLVVRAGVNVQPGSGVLMTADHEVQLPRHAALEMIFEMPSEISGQPHSDVLCDDTIF